MTKTTSILIVDDSLRMRATIRSMLIALPADVVGECDNGADAVVAYEALKPDWVLMDISMPGLDGITATRRIHEIDADAKVVIVTDYPDASLAYAAAEAGAVAFVRKDDLFSLLEIIA